MRTLAAITHLCLVRQMRQRGRVEESGSCAIHDVLVATVVARLEATTAVLEDRTALQLGRFYRFQRVKIGIFAVVD